MVFMHFFLLGAGVIVWRRGAVREKSHPIKNLESPPSVVSHEDPCWQLLRIATFLSPWSPQFVLMGNGAGD